MLHGLAGNDMLEGGVDADRIEGGAGEDTATYASRLVRVVASLDGSWNDGADSDGNDASEEYDNVTADVEKVIGDGGADPWSETA
jgi:hypothetical protein